MQITGPFGIMTIMPGSTRAPARRGRGREGVGDRPRPAAATARAYAPGDAPDRFRLSSEFEPKGDQPRGDRRGCPRVCEAKPRTRCCWASPGSGKTFTMAKVIDAVKRPTLVIAHNKTLAAQLYSEFKQLLPGQRRRVLRLATTTTTSPRRTSRRPTRTSRRMRPSTTRSTACATRATRSLLERRDVIIVASVSCIYGLGSPEAYYGMLLLLEKGGEPRRATTLLRKLVDDPVRAQRRRPSIAAPSGCAATCRDLPGVRGRRHPDRALRRRGRVDQP